MKRKFSPKSHDMWDVYQLIKRKKDEMDRQRQSKQVNVNKEKKVILNLKCWPILKLKIMSVGDNELIIFRQNNQNVNVNIQSLWQLRNH